MNIIDVHNSWKRHYENQYNFGYDFIIIFFVTRDCRKRVNFIIDKFCLLSANIKIKRYWLKCEMWNVKYLLSFECCYKICHLITKRSASSWEWIVNKNKYGNTFFPFHGFVDISRCNLVWHISRSHFLFLFGTKWSFRPECA